MKAAILLLVLVLNLTSVSANTSRSDETMTFDLRSVSEGRMTVYGEWIGYPGEDRNVEVYVNGVFLAKEETWNHEFYFLTPRHTLKTGDIVTIRVPDLFPDGSHFEKKVRYNYDPESVSTSWETGCWNNTRVLGQSEYYCRLNQTSYADSFSCSMYSMTQVHEEICFKLKTTHETAAACSQVAVGSSRLFILLWCFETVDLAPEKIKECFRAPYLTLAQQKQCLKIASDEN